MTTTADAVAALRSLSSQDRRDLIDACIQSAVFSCNTNPDFVGRLVNLAAMIGEPVDVEKSQRALVAGEIADWFESGHGTGSPGNQRIAERIRSKFGTS